MFLFLPLRSQPIRYQQIVRSASDESININTDQSQHGQLIEEPSRIRRFCLTSIMCAASLFVAISLGLFLFHLWDNKQNSAFHSLANGPVCSIRTLEYLEYVTRHNELVRAMSLDCNAVFAADNLPRILVHDCSTNCSGLGDRIAKMAGFFQYALLTNRFLFINQHNPNVSDWLDPVDFDWRYSGKVAQCLDSIKRQASDTNDPLHDCVYINDNVTETQFEQTSQFTSWINRLRHHDHLDQSINQTINQSILFIDANVNLVRPLQLTMDFPVSSETSHLLPKVNYRDDTRASLLTGCLLSRLFTFNQHLRDNNHAFLINQSINQSNTCQIGLHYRFGDAQMFHFNGTEAEGASYDNRIDANHPNIMIKQGISCAIQQAIAYCPFDQSISLFVATDSPQFIDLIKQQCLSLSQLSKTNLTLLMTPSSTPTHTSTFSQLNDQQRQIAEQQLFQDYSMLASSKIIISTRSTFSFTAASLALQYPIDATSCKVQWW